MTRAAERMWCTGTRFSLEHGQVDGQSSTVTRVRTPHQELINIKEATHIPVGTGTKSEPITSNQTRVDDPSPIGHVACGRKSASSFALWPPARPPPVTRDTTVRCDGRRNGGGSIRPPSGEAGARANPTPRPALPQSLARVASGELVGGSTQHNSLCVRVGFGRAGRKSHPLSLRLT